MLFVCLFDKMTCKKYDCDDITFIFILLPGTGHQNDVTILFFPFFWDVLTLEIAHIVQFLTVYSIPAHLLLYLDTDN